MSEDSTPVKYKDPKSAPKPAITLFSSRTSGTSANDGDANSKETSSSTEKKASDVQVKEQEANVDNDDKSDSSNQAYEDIHQDTIEKKKTHPESNRALEFDDLNQKVNTNISHTSHSTIRSSDKTDQTPVESKDSSSLSKQMSEAREYDNGPSVEMKGVQRSQINLNDISKSKGASNFPSLSLTPAVSKNEGTIGGAASSKPRQHSAVDSPLIIKSAPFDNLYDNQRVDSPFSDILEQRGKGQRKSSTRSKTTSSRFLEFGQHKHGQGSVSDSFTFARYRENTDSDGTSSSRSLDDLDDSQNASLTEGLSKDDSIKSTGMPLFKDLNVHKEGGVIEQTDNDTNNESKEISLRQGLACDKTEDTFTSSTNKPLSSPIQSSTRAKEMTERKTKAVDSGASFSALFSKSGPCHVSTRNRESPGDAEDITTQNSSQGRHDSQDGWSRKRSESSISPSIQDNSSSDILSSPSSKKSRPYSQLLDEDYENKIGDKSRPYSLPTVTLGNSVHPGILAASLVEILDSKNNHVCIIDCRFPYEYHGGHIVGAVNLYTDSQIHDEFLKGKVQLESKTNDKIILIFYCEFSSERAPACALYLRNEDRNLHDGKHPILHYPEICMLKGGYKEFYEYCNQNNQGALCTPNGYIEMSDESYQNECAQYTKEKREKSLSKRSRTKPISKQT